MQWASLTTEIPSFAKKRKRVKGALARGISYERKAQRYLEKRYQEFYVPSPWFRFKESGSSQLRWCQPDGLLFLIPYCRIIIVEIKLRHTAEAYWQSKLLYGPVLKQAFPSQLWELAHCEVTQWYDPVTAFPEYPALYPDVLLTDPIRYGVHIWKPGRGNLGE